jgi:phosphate uptake regulator
MFKNIIRFWQGKDFLKQVLEDFKSMLEDAQDMFNIACDKVIYGKMNAEAEDKIYGIDRKINELEKDIRKRVVEHLTIQPSVDVSTSLLLMSVVKDAERLGDYSKNLFEVSRLLSKPVDVKTYRSLFSNIHEELIELFSQTKRAFIESDESIAAGSWDYERKIVKRCEEIIERAAKSDLSVNEAVCFALIARYFKRLAAHLANIGTSVILPVSDLDYFDEKRRER